MNEQYEELLKLMSETPNIMNVFEENVQLKQKIDEMETGEKSSNQLSLILQQIVKTSEITKTFEESLLDRKFVRDRLEKFNMMRMPVEGQVQVIEDQIHTLKIEHNEVIEKLNYDLAK